jgi:hypothetical protein
MRPREEITLPCVPYCSWQTRMTRPVLHGRGFGPPCSPEALAEITQLVVLGLDPERLDLARHRSSSVPTSSEVAAPTVP